jgi:hypothetical protein
MGPFRSVSPAVHPDHWRGGVHGSPVPEYGRLNMRVRLIFAALAVGALLLAGCGSTPSHRPAARDRRQQVVTGVMGAVGPPESPKEKQLARELSGVEGESP